MLLQINKIKTEQMIGIIEAADTEFLTLFRRNEPLPCCTTIWISQVRTPAKPQRHCSLRTLQLPDVYPTLERVYELATQRPLISDDALARLRSLVERWAPPAPAEISSAESEATQDTAQVAAG